MIIVSLFISIITAAIGFFVQHKGIIWASYGIAIPIALLLTRFFYYFDSKVKNTVNFKWVRKLDFFAFFIVLFNVPGSLILHDLNFQYDRPLHFSAAFFSMIVFFMLWLPVVKIKNKEIRKKKFIVFIFVVMFFALLAWESLQYVIDQIFGTELFFDPSQTKIIDSSEDVFFGFLGLITGAFYLNRSFNKIILSVWK